MGCGSSSLKGSDYSEGGINAKTSPSLATRISTMAPAVRARTQSTDTPYTSKPQVQSVHYESARERDQDLRALESAQRRPSRPAYVDIEESLEHSASYTPAKAKYHRPTNETPKPNRFSGMAQRARMSSAQGAGAGGGRVGASRPDASLGDRRGVSSFIG